MDGFILTATFFYAYWLIAFPVQVVDAMLFRWEGQSKIENVLIPIAVWVFMVSFAIGMSKIAGVIFGG